MRFRKIVFIKLISFLLLTSIFSVTKTSLAKSNLLTSDIVISGNLAYIFVMDKGLQIVNISNPNEPQFISHLKMNYHFTDDMTIVGDYLYFTAYNLEIDSDEFIIVNISKPVAPVLVAVNKLELCTIPHFYILNNLMLIPHDKLEIINISDPYLPETIGDYNIGSVKGISFKENNALILTNSGLSIINLSTPSNPTLINNYTNLTGSYLSLKGDYAIISRFRAVQIFDISNLSDITLMSSLAVEYLRGHSVSNDLIFYLKSGIIYTNMIGIINFSNPLSLSEITVYNLEEEIRKIQAVDHYVYIATIYTGMIILDISEPTNPKMISKYDIFLPFIQTRNIILISFSLLIVVVLIPILLRKKKEN